MKIGLLVPEIPPDAVGGGGAVFLALATRLSARGHEVAVVTSATHRGPRELSPPDAFELLRVPEFAHPSAAYRTSMPPIPSAPLLDAVRRLRRADIVNAHGYACPLVDVLGLSLDPRRIVYTLHGFLYTIPQRGGPIAEAYRLYDAVLGARLLRRAATVTAVSTAVQRQAQARGRTDCRVIPNGFAPAPPAALSPELAREADRGPFLLCIGRLQWLKGFDVALRALRIARDRGHPLRLLIAGRDAGYQADLRAQAGDLDLTGAVSLLGQVPSDRLVTLLARSIAFLMPSRTESFSLTSLEAMSAGAPAILSNVGGIPDIATDGLNALLVEPENPRALADAVERLLHDPALRTSLVANARLRSRDFDWNAIVRCYEEIYERTRSLP